MRSHSTFKNDLAQDESRAAGLSSQLRPSVLIPGSSLRPTEDLFQPPAFPSSASPGEYIACDLTFCSPCKSHTTRRAVTSAACNALLGSREKPCLFNCYVRGSLSFISTDKLHILGYRFVPVLSDIQLNHPDKSPLMQITTLQISRNDPPARLRLQQHESVTGYFCGNLNYKSRNTYWLARSGGRKDVLPL